MADLDSSLMLAGELEVRKLMAKEAELVATAPPNRDYPDSYVREIPQQPELSFSRKVARWWHQREQNRKLKSGAISRGRTE